MNYGFQQPRDATFPPIVHVETTNACNLRCIHCPHHDVKAVIPDYQAQVMANPLWRRIVDEVACHGAALRLTPDGEPMLGKSWIEQVRYAQDQGVDTLAFNTNGMFLEGEKAAVLLRDTPMKVSVEVSLDGFYRETYERIRVRGNYPRILRNIMAFITERDRLRRDQVKLMVSIVQQPEVSDAEIEAFDTFWSQLADKVIIRNYVDTKGLTPKKHIEERQVLERWPCLVLFTRLVVTWDGRVRFCPDDWQKATTLTTLEEAGSLQAVWQSERFQALRQSHLSGEFTHPTCARCTDWKVIRWGADYTKALATLFDPTAPTPAGSARAFLWNQDRDGRAGLPVLPES